MTDLEQRSVEAEARVRNMLVDSLTPRGVEQWLGTRSRYLGGRRACDVLLTDPELVLQAADAWVSGAYL